MQAARFDSNKFRYKDILHERRQDQRLVLFNKIINGLTSVDRKGILLPADSCTRANHGFKFKHLQSNCEAFRYSFAQPLLPAGTSFLLIVKAVNVEGFKLGLARNAH